MKILFLAEYYPPFIMGGAEICLESLVNEMIKQGHEVTVLTPNCKNNKDVIINNDKLTIYRYKSIKRFTYKKKSKDVSAIVYQKSNVLFSLILNQFVKVFTWEMLREAKKLLKYETFDIIHSNNVESGLVLSKLKTTAKRVAHIRDLSFTCLNYRTRNNKYCDYCSMKHISECMETNIFFAKLLYFDILRRRLCAILKINNFITINKYVSDNIFVDSKVINDPISNKVISKLTKFQARKVCNISNLKNVILFVSSLTEIKGALTVLKLARTFPKYNFIVIGDGPLKNEFENCNLNNLYYKGRLSLSELRNYYKACDVFLNLSTVHYGTGCVVVEAQMNGLPVLSTNVPKLDNVFINNKTGIIVNNNINDINEALFRLINYKALRDTISKNSIESTKDKYNIEILCKEVINYYDTL